MSVFRNISNNGVWPRGGTYTIEVYCPDDSLHVHNRYAWDSDTQSCDTEAETWHLWGSNIVGDADLHQDYPCSMTYEAGGLGNVLFTNKESNRTGGIAGSVCTWLEEVETDWWKVSIFVPTDATAGKVYLKYCDYDRTYKVGGDDP